MKSLISFLPRLLLLVGVALPLGDPLSAADTDPIAESEIPPGVELNQEDLDELLGPIALYPDALIALILPAATSQAEIVLAARFVAAKGDPSQIDSQPWSDSVKALAHYPEVITWMDANLQWTKELGDAFYNQPSDVMNSVQRLRSVARKNGVLVDTPQQKVVVEDQAIEILPAQPDVIYVPQYDPEIVYVERPVSYYPEPFITFGTGLIAGLWLNYDFDWRRRQIWVGDRSHDWREHRDWRRRYSSSPTYRDNPNFRAWRPPVRRIAPSRDGIHSRPRIVRPQPFPGSPDYRRLRAPESRDGRNPPRHDGPRTNPDRQRPDGSRDRGDRRDGSSSTITPGGTLNRATPIDRLQATPVEPSRATAPTQTPAVERTEQPRRTYSPNTTYWRRSGQHPGPQTPRVQNPAPVAHQAVPPAAQPHNRIAAPHQRPEVADWNNGRGFARGQRHSPPAVARQIQPPAVQPTQSAPPPRRFHAPPEQRVQAAPGNAGQGRGQGPRFQNAPAGPQHAQASNRHEARQRESQKQN